MGKVEGLRTNRYEYMDNFGVVRHQTPDLPAAGEGGDQD